jgi:crossover junction endodeoxyribonuclease RusA
MTFVITLDAMPPPLSACYKNAAGRGRVKTQRYKVWENRHLMINPQLRGAVKFTTAVRVHIGIIRPDKRKRDLDNLLKPICDLLVAGRVLADDSLIHELSIRWHTRCGDDRPEVEICVSQVP